jgi:acetyltransferase-like isoleucine patch superfamily enzyme
MIGDIIISVLQKCYNSYVFGKARLRAKFWGLFTKRMGKNAYILDYCHIYNPKGVEIGDYTGINHHTDIGGRGGLRIGNYVMIGPYCQILTAEHEYRNQKLPIYLQPIKCNEVVIEDDVWIGTKVVVLPGVCVGKGAIVGAGSVVTKNVEPYSIVAGVPAKFLKSRFPRINK